MRASQHNGVAAYCTQLFAFYMIWEKNVISSVVLEKCVVDQDQLWILTEEKQKDILKFTTEAPE